MLSCSDGGPKHDEQIRYDPRRDKCKLTQNKASAKPPARIEKLIAAIRTRLSCLETIGKLSGELRPAGMNAGQFVPGKVAPRAI